ncbi:Phage DNA packaging protein, Nu1 subunit of terminase [Thiothrix eikelboomii]|uniref:Phage DNA packaging protein, Nu1 subunit of terminase n=1 Tax=Thiothrix eikelboomii TaxID=92487 RepID=A0A1T4W6F6_9GAMM|nr:hypothetical protein [Thiothrix eikelboomii]SKA72301.1 Phage DNA packaging protein, Nu1 subunit of terminase [Thiothrix eikelboomii]
MSSERLSYPVEIMSRLLLLTPRRVQQLANEGVVEKTDRGRYDLIKSVQGYIRYLNDQIPNKASNDVGVQGARVDAEVERAKWLMHRAELARLDTEEKKSMLVDAEVQRRDAFRIARAVRTAVLNIPLRISQDLANDHDPLSVHRKLESALIEALTELADEISQMESDPIETKPPETIEPVVSIDQGGHD